MGSRMRDGNERDIRRLKEIYSRVVDALADVVRDLAVSEDELHIAGRFFNRLGSAGAFPSLLDLSLAMASIEGRLMHSGTRPNLEGPYYVTGAPERPDGVLFERSPGPTAEVCVLTGRVTEVGTGGPIQNAELDIWQADETGAYDYDGFNLRGIVRTGPDGRYRVVTVIPADYPQHQTDPIGELLGAMGAEVFRPAHIHLKVRVAGREVLTTQFFMADSPHLATDYVVGAVVPELLVERKSIERSDGRPMAAMSFDIELSLHDAAS